jgi:hypothetical protein
MKALRAAAGGYLWNLGVATSIWLNAAFWPGSLRGETVCAHCDRAGCRFCALLGRVANLLEPDHCRRSREACRARHERLRAGLAHLLETDGREDT